MKRLAMRLDARLENLLTSPLMTKKRIFSIMLPLFLDQLTFVALNMFNTGMISSTGVAAVSAVGMVDTLNNLICQLYLAVAMAGTVLVAKHSGANNPAMVSRASVLSLASGLFIGLVLALVFGLFRGPVLQIVYKGADPEVLGLAKVYLLGVALVSPGNAVINSGNGALRGMGETKTSLTVSLITNVSYALLNLLFLPVLHLGVYGLLYALVLSRLLGCFCVWLFLSRRHIFLQMSIKASLREAKSLMGDMLQFALPFTVESLFFCGGLLAVQMILVGFGTNALAANTIAASILGLMSCAGDALYNTTVTIVGQCMGQNGVKEARRYVKVFLNFASIASFVILALLLLFFPLLIKMFGAPAELTGTIFYLLAGSGVMYILFWPRSFLIPACLRTAGDVRFASLVILTSVWVVRVTACYVFAVVFKLGVYGTWAGMCFEWAVRGLIFTLRLKTDKWHERHKNVMAAQEG
ncbi:MAG: MATE family efflux transporter [Clostridiaceae bacterium]